MPSIFADIHERPMRLNFVLDAHNRVIFIKILVRLRLLICANGQASTIESFGEFFQILTSLYRSSELNNGLKGFVGATVSHTY